MVILFTKSVLSRLLTPTPRQGGSSSNYIIYYQLLDKVQYNPSFFSLIVGGMCWGRVRVLASYASLSLCSLSGTLSETSPKVSLPKDCVHVGYVTDIEGNLDYWRRYKRISRVLETEQGKLRLRDDCLLVFGGDVCDRGPGDLRIIQELLELKAAYPDRVFFILGNRDVNKLRFAVDASDKLITKELYPYWISPLQVSGTGAGSISRRVQWMLKSSMGAPLTFEYRRKELAELGLPCSDDDVAKSFIESVQSKGCLTKMLHHGQLGLVIQDTLFVHGALLPHVIARVPPQLENEGQDLKQWISALNEFKTNEMEDYIRNIEDYISRMEPLPSSSWSHVGGFSHAQPGSRLVHYGMGWNPDRSVNPSIIYSNFLGDKGQYHQLPDAVSEYCKASGIRRVIVGHQPVGDCPLPIASKLNEVIALCGDTSYANDVIWEPFDTSLFPVFEHSSPPPEDSSRGSAVSEILVSFGPRGDSTATVHGILSNNLKYEYSLSDPDARLLGRDYRGWWAKAILYGGPNADKFILMSRKDGFRVANKIVPICEIAGT